MALKEPEFLPLEEGTLSSTNFRDQLRPSQGLVKAIKDRKPAMATLPKRTFLGRTKRVMDDDRFFDHSL